LLSPELNEKISKFEVHEGCTVKVIFYSTLKKKITKFSRMVNEKVSGGKKFIKIENLEKISDFCSASFEIPTFLMNPILKEKEFYYPLYDNDNFSNPNNTQLEYWEPEVGKPTLTLKQIKKTGKQFFFVIFKTPLQ
jgi:hypothetical protein